MFLVQLRRILDFMNVIQNEPTTIYTDLESAIALIKRGSLSTYTKHINVGWKKLQELHNEYVLA